MDIHVAFMPVLGQFFFINVERYLLKAFLFWELAIGRIKR